MRKKHGQKSCAIYEQTVVKHVGEHGQYSAFSFMGEGEAEGSLRGTLGALWVPPQSHFVSAYPMSDQEGLGQAFLIPSADRGTITGFNHLFGIILKDVPRRILRAPASFMLAGSLTHPMAPPRGPAICPATT